MQGSTLVEFFNSSPMKDSRSKRDVEGGFLVSNTGVVGAPELGQTSSRFAEALSDGNLRPWSLG